MKFLQSNCCDMKMGRHLTTMLGAGYKLPITNFQPGVKVSIYLKASEGSRDHAISLLGKAIRNLQDYSHFHTNLININIVPTKVLIDNEQ